MVQEALQLPQDLSALMKPPRNKHKQLRFIEWQTWPFHQLSPKVGWSRGICEANDFFTFIKPAIHTIGQLTYWREISIGEM